MDYKKLSQMQNLIKIFLQVLPFVAMSFVHFKRIDLGGFKLPKPGDARTMEMEGEKS